MSAYRLFEEYSSGIFEVTNCTNKLRLYKLCMAEKMVIMFTAA